MTPLDYINANEIGGISSIYEMIAVLANANGKVFNDATVGDAFESRSSLAEYAAICKKSLTGIGFYLNKPPDDLIKKAVADFRKDYKKCPSLLDASGRCELMYHQVVARVYRDGLTGMSDVLVGMVASVILIMEDLELHKISKKK